MSVNDTSVAAQKAVDRRYAEMSFIEKADRVRAVTLAANAVLPKVFGVPSVLEVDYLDVTAAR